jgi:hypothetical protein
LAMAFRMIFRSSMHTLGKVAVVIGVTFGALWVLLSRSR